MGSCCGRRNVRGQPGAAEYYQRYGYLTKQQIAEKEKLLGTNCPSCAALTVSNADGACSVCGNQKPSGEENKG